MNIKNCFNKVSLKLLKFDFLVLISALLQALGPML